MPVKKNKKPIKIREVYSQNLESELDLLSTLIPNYHFISMDTEFPGVIYKTPHVHPTRHHKFRKPSPTSFYQTLKSNVDVLNIIQLGITLSNARGELPDLGSDYFFIWQFNFSDFDLARDSHAPESINLLKKQGIDFERNKEFGIDSARFAELVMATGLVCNEEINWVTFHSAYDFGYLVKILTRRALPSSLTEFMDYLRAYFGESVYDIKYMMGFCNGLNGGLERVAGLLNVGRVVGKGHQAGSDSLLTWHVFERLRDLYFVSSGHEKYAGVLYGLELEVC